MQTMKIKGIEAGSCTLIAVHFCLKTNVSKVFIGQPDGVRKQSTDRKHNQRLAGREYGKDIDSPLPINLSKWA